MVVDTPVDYRHEDLAANFDLSRSPGLAAIGLNTVHSHGTAMASHIAARDNKVGMRGVAPRATLTWYDFHKFASDSNSDSSRWNETAMQAAVINHSYSQTGVSQPLLDKYGHGLAYDKLSESGFGGLGTLNVISGGKQRYWPEIEYSSLAEYRSHPAVVVACSTAADGTRSGNLNTSLRGPGLWICSMPSGIYAVNKDRYAVQSGTPSSPSTAIISGVAALVRAANPGLTWRDVKLILAESAQHNHPGSSGWQQAGAKRTDADERYRYHHSYGFGVIDAGAAVQLALDWVTLPEYLEEQHATSMESTAIPDDGSEVSDTINATSGIDFVEYVIAELDLDAPNFRDLQVELVSPSGTVSVLAEPMPKVGEGTQYYDCDREGDCPISGKFRFGSAVHLGEAASGAWKLRISDEKENGHLNTLKSWSLKLYGHNTQTPTTADGPTPTVTVTGGQAAVEGDAVSFTFTASPAPTVPQTVNLEVAQDGEYGAWTGERTLTMPTSGTVTLSMPTTDDNTDETDGSVTVTVNSGTGYTTSQTQNSASVAVTDNDLPLPVVSIAVHSDVIVEGGLARFKVSAKPRAVSPTIMKITFAKQGDFGITTSIRHVAVPMSGSISISVSTTNDNTDEPDGSITATIEADAGYKVSPSAGSAIVTLLDDDGPPDPEISIAAGGDVAEGDDAVFTVTATPKPATDLDVKVSVSQSGDFGVSAGSRTVTIPTAGSFVLTVPTTNDSVDEPDGSVTATIGTGAGYTVSSLSGSASAAVSDDDDSPSPLPADCVSDETLESARDYYDLHRDRAPGYGRNWRRVLIAFGDVVDDQLTAFTAAEALAREQIWFGWKPFREALECIEAAQQPPPPDPQISIATGSGVIEGSAASFTLTASPKPSADLDVTVAVSQSGDFGVPTGSRTVTIPASGSQTFTVATANDAVDEPDGSVTAAISAGTGYTVSSSAGSATVAAADDDVPEVSIAAGSGIAEGGDATFTVTAVPAPHSALSVEVSVAVSGDFGTTTGSRTVTIPTAGSFALTVPTTGDGVDEPDGSVTATVSGGTGYTVSSSAGSASVAVSDDDDPPPPPPPPPSNCISDGTLESARDYYELHRDRAPGYGRNWRRVLIAFGDIVDDPLTAFTAAEALAREQIWFGWRPFREALECIEAARQTPPPPPPDPQISIAAGSGVTEGTATSFTLAASPAPTAALTVDVTVSQSGDFGVATGSRTVTIPTTGTFTLTVATTGDSTDEVDGSVTVTVDTGTGYTVSSSAGSATVAVADDDDPAPPPPADPEISIAAGNDVTEGTAATFTLTASPAPTTALSVSVTVAHSGSFGVSTGARTVTIPTGGSYTLSVATADDSTDEPDGSVTVTIADGTGYTVSQTQGSATVAVSDDDDPPPPPPPPADPQISITAGSDVTEGDDAIFTLTASPQPASALPVTVTVSQNGSYGATTGARTVTIPTTGTYTLTVATTNDSADEPDGSVSITIGTRTGYTVSQTQGSATVAVSDDDDPPRKPPTGPLTLTVADASASEGDSRGLRFVATLSRASDQEIKLGYGAFDITAKYNQDFTIPYRLYTIQPGETQVEIVVPLIDDNMAEPDETLRLYAYDSTFTTILGFTYATGTITDNDYSPG